MFLILRTTLPVYLTVAQVTVRVVQAAAAVSDFTVLQILQYPCLRIGYIYTHIIASCNNIMQLKHYYGSLTHEAIYRQQ